MHWQRVVVRPLAGLACCACFGLSVPVRAADATEESLPDSETPADVLDVIVTAAREPVPLAESSGATTVVTEDVLRTAPKMLSVGEALALVPGLKIDTQYASEKSHLSIRGQGILTETGIRGIEILLDGIPLNGPGGFAPDLYDVDWATVDHVEVIRGLSGALYGGGSSAGVINIVTKDGSSVGGDGELGAFTGSNHYFKSLGQLGGTSGAVNYRFSASSASGDGSREHSAFAATNFYGKATFQVSPTFTLSTVAMGTNYRNENPEGLNLEQFNENPWQANPDSITYDEYQQTRRITLGVVGRVALSKQDDLDVTLYGRHTDYKESFPAAVLYRTLDNPGALVKYTHRSGTGSVRNHFSIGADYNGQAIDEYRREHVEGSVNEYPEHVSDDSVNQTMYGAYLMDRVELGAHWAATVNVRYDNVDLSLHDNLASAETGDLSGSRSFDETTARVGVTWNPRPGFTAYATWGQGFMPPSVEEMLANPEHYGGFNAQIVPASSTGEELGVRGSIGPSTSYDVALFYLTTENDFGRYRTPERPLETFYYNEGDSRRYGLETAWTYAAAPFALRLAYTWNHFTYTRIDSQTFPTAEPGNVLPNSPEHKAYLDAEYSPSRRWFVGLSTDMQSKSYVDATNVPTTDAYALLHARAGYRWSMGQTRAELSLALRNATGKVYVAYSEPDPDGNSYQAGPGREWFASARFLFGAR